jgi:hypothetical protein
VGAIGVTERHHVLWHCSALSSSELGTLEAHGDGWVLRGWTVLPVDGVPGRIEHDVLIDGGWRTQAATVIIHTDRVQRHEVRVADGAWTVNGVERPDLDGCIDIDLGWTPATNVLPIRRLGLAVGEAATTVASWFRFPELAIERNDQRYERTAPLVWRYLSGAYDFQLDVDELGRVVRYGDDLWRAVAS